MSYDEGNNSKEVINRRSYLKLTGLTGTGFGTGVGASVLGTEFSTSAQAATAVVDDFSDTNLSGRYVFNQRNATTSVTTISSPVVNEADTNVLQIEGDGDGSTVMHAFMGDGDTDLNAYPEIGDTFSCWVRGLNGTEIMNFSYGVQDGNNKYYVQFNLDSGHLGLFKYVDGSGYSLAGDWSNLSIQNNTGWFKVELQWTTAHQHTVTLYQNGSKITSFSYTEDSGDPQFTANGVGFSGHVSSGETAQFDYSTTSSSSGDTASGPTGYCEFDSFEDANLDAYDFDQGSVGDPGAHLVSSPTIEGSQALAISDMNVEMISTSGLKNYPTAANNTLIYWVQVTNGDENVNVSYGVQDHENRYYIKLDYSKQWMGLFKYENGSGTTIEGTGLSLDPDVWYRVEIDWNCDGTHAVTLRKDTDPELHDNSDTVVAQFSGNDSTWRAGGIGFDSYLQDGGTTYFETSHGCREGGC